MKWSEIVLGTLRPYKYGTFISCLAGAIVAAPTLILSWLGLAKVVLFFVSFAVLAYSGIYILNDVSDYVSDSRNPAKRRRLVASGSITRTQAILIAIILILLGAALGYKVSPLLPAAIGAFLCINVLYSTVLKHIPYLDLLVNTVTHPLRAVLGILLFGQISAQHIPLILASAAFYLGTNSIKRHLETSRGQFEYRPVLALYNQLFLGCLAWGVVPLMLVLTILSEFPIQFSFVAFALVMYSFIVVSYWSGIPRLHSLVCHMLTR